MIKRIFALTLAFLMALSMMITAVSAEETVLASLELTEAEKFFMGIGAIDGDKYNQEAVLTRGEFAQFLMQIAKLKSFLAETESGFTDVPENHKNYGAIRAVHSLGIMNGIGDGMFAPDYNIVLNQAVKVLVDLMGYTPFALREGGYPGGYITVAGKLGLLKKVSGTSTKDATYRDVLQLFYNALDVEVQAITGATDKGIIHTKVGETFAESVLKLKKLEGRVTDNGFTSLSGTSKINENNMVIAGIKVDVTETVNYARDYIGLDVDAYYRTDAEAEKPLAYVIPDKNDNLTFELSDFVSISQSDVTYYNGKKNVKENLAKGFTMIYNGAVFDPVIPSALVGLSGEMTLISTDSKGYDLIVVNSYENIFVDSIDKAEKIIYNGIRYKSGYTGRFTLDFSNESTYDFLNVVTYDGLQSSFDKIRQGDVISAKVSRDGRVVTLIVEREFTETFVLDNYEVIDNECTISDGENSYKVPDFSKLALPDLIRGNKYTVHFNKFGEVAWIEAASSKYPIGFLVGAEDNSGSYVKDYSVRLFTTDGEFLNLKLGEKIYYNNFNKKTEDIFAELSTYIGSAVLYEADEGVLLRIVMPEDLGVDSNRGWYRISPETYGCQQDSGLNDAEWSDHKETIWSDVGEWKHVGDKFAFVEGTSTGMYVPPRVADYGDDSGYGIFLKSPKSYTKKAIEGYSREYNDVIADLQLVKVEGTGIHSTGMEMLLVSEITTRANDEGEPVMIINGYKTSYGNNGVSKVSYPVAEGAVVSGCSMNDIDDVSAGDIMMFSLSGDDELTTIEIFYDCDTGNSESILQSSYHVDKGYIYSSGENWTRTTTIAPEALDMTNVSDYIQTVGRHHSYPNALIIVSDIDGRLFFDISTISDLKSYTKTQGVCDYLVTLSNGSESIFGSVAYR